jgi:hypothetical protein
VELATPHVCAGPRDRLPVIKLGIKGKTSGLTGGQNCCKSQDEGNMFGGRPWQIVGLAM